MIIHRLIAHHLKHGDDTAFYEMQAKDAVSWMQSRHVAMNTKVQVLDLGCGHGVFGGELEKFDCQVSYADIECNLNTERASAPFTHINLDEDDYEELGRYDLIVCSNVCGFMCGFMFSCNDIIFQLKIGIGISPRPHIRI